MTAASGEATGVSWAEAGGGGPNAWVNFNGTGTVAIRANSNVSSITDRATGKYTVNFTSDMDDDDYCVAATTNLDAVRDLGFRTQAFAVGSIEVEQFNSDSNYKDAEFGCVAVFR